MRGSIVHAAVARVASSRDGWPIVGKLVSDVAARLSIVVVVILAVRYGDIDDLGAWSQLQVLSSLLAPIAVLGLSNAMVPVYASRPWNPEVRRSATVAFGWATLSCALATVVLAVLAPVADRFILDWPRGVELFRWGAPMVAITGFEFLVLSLLQARRRFGTYIVVQLGSTAVLLAGAALVLPLQGDIVSLVRFVTAGRAIVLALGALAAVRGGAVVASASTPPALWGMIRFGVGVTIADLGSWVVQLGDRFVVGYHQTARELGAYAAVYTATGVLSLLGAAVFLPAFPRMATSWSTGGRSGLQLSFRTFHQPLSIAVVPATLFVIVVFGPAFDVLARSPSRPQIWVTMLIAAAVGLNQWNGLAHHALIVVGGGRAVRAPWFVGGALAVGSALVLVPLLGLLGAAISTAMALLTVDVMLAVRLGQHIDLRAAYALGPTVHAAVATVPATIASLVVFALASKVAALVLGSATFWAVYVIALLVLRQEPFVPLSEEAPASE